MKGSEIRKMVREGYATIAKKNQTCCGQDAQRQERPPSRCGGGAATSHASKCCGSKGTDDKYAGKVSYAIGYTPEDMESVPDGSNLGLGCGNPIALASLKEGEVVVDLGSGAGFDCFLAAKRVGASGRVIGVDMTHEMLEKARGNAEKGGYTNVEFRLGEIEYLPIADAAANAIISNCVINLSPDKMRVFREAYRVLKKGGRLMVSDIVLERELPAEIRKSVAAYVGCLGGAVLKSEYLRLIDEAGFKDVEILEENYYALEFMRNDPTGCSIAKHKALTPKDIADLNHAVLSVRVKAVKK